MLCEICKTNPATMHSVTIINGEREEHAFCAECAAKLQDRFADNGNWDFMEEFFPSMVNMLFDFYDMPPMYALAGARGGYALGEETPERYEKRRELSPAEKRQQTLEALREQLAAAVHEERYEDAAKLRDEISKMTAKAGDGK
ncbi:MAG: UvrB/UvrC motif-containing protein [Eubacteriales bacterium]|nr:UvrB/UvrC motif-containing protein [Eubacteriales bacterium]